MPSFTLPDNWYGPGTDRIRTILCQAQEIRWFSFVPSDNYREQLVMLVRRHVDALPELDQGGNKPVVSDVQLLEGDWSVLHQGRWGVDCYNAWGDRWKAAEEYLGRISHRLHQAIDSSADARRLLRPPLWPVGKPIVCGEPLFADADFLIRTANVKPGGRDWCVAWALLCKAEAYLWDALLWELARGVKAIHGPNPFQELLGLYGLGAFPMGWVGDSYELYLPKISTGATAEKPVSSL